MSNAMPAEVTAYLQLELRRRLTYAPSEARVVRATQKKPEQAAPGCIVVKVKLRVPIEGWDAFEPEAVIDVPDELIQHPIEVQAVDPS